MHKFPDEEKKINEFPAEEKKISNWRQDVNLEALLIGLLVHEKKYITSKKTINCRMHTTLYSKVDDGSYLDENFATSPFPAKEKKIEET